MFQPGLRCFSMVALEQTAEPFLEEYRTFLGQNEPIAQSESLGVEQYQAFFEQGD